MSEVGGTRLKRLILHIAVRWHLALAMRAANRAQMHSRKCMLAQIRLTSLDAEGK